MPQPRDETSVNSSSQSLENNDAATEVTKKPTGRQSDADTGETAGVENAKPDDGLARDDLPENERVAQQNDFA